MPKFSIILPTYNRANHIAKTIKSVLNQSFKDFELLIIDDGSTDQTQSVVQSFNDKRIKYYYKKNEERGAARNFGVTKSNGTLITFLDSDDIFYQDHLEIANKVSIKQPNKVFWQGFDIRDENNNLIQKHVNKKGTILEHLINDGNIMACMGVFLPIEIIEVNSFIEDRALSGSEDMELWLRIASKYTILKVNKASGALINHNDRSVLNVEFESLKERKELMLKYVFSSKNAIILSSKNKIIANAYSYIALHGALSKVKRESIVYILKSIWIWPMGLFKKRTWATFKRLV